MNALRSRIVAAGLLALCGLAQAATPTPGAQQRAADRAAITAERGEVNARFEARQRACQAQFVVTACLNEAVETRRLALSRLHARELELNDAQRRETAALRQAEIDARAAATQARASDPAPAVRHEAARAPKSPNPPNAGHAGGKATGAQGAVASAQRRLEEQRNEAAFAAKTRAAEAHREAVLKRNAARVASGKVAAPLPVPASAP